MRNPVKKLHNAVTFIRHFGIIGFTQELYYRFINYYQDRRLGIDTSSSVKLSDLGVDKPDTRDYYPLGYNGIYSTLKKLPLDKSNSVFLDYGTGKGRPIIAAATFPFKRVIGVEIAGYLVDIAKTNVSRMKYRKAECIELVQLDAKEFIIPKDVNVIFFFNPFKGNILRKVVTNIYSSFKECPRKIYIIFFNNDHFEEIINNQNWLVKIYQTEFYPNYSCGMYETVSAQDHYILKQHMDANMDTKMGC